MKLTGICALAAVLLAAGCGSDSDSAGGDTTPTEVPPTTATTPITTTTTTTTTTTPTPTPKPQGTTVTILVHDAAPQGGIQRPKVKRGERVTFVVRSDVADEVHLHGYDRSADVAPGNPARITFVADVPGRFEIELEERHVLLAQLTVS